MTCLLLIEDNLGDARLIEKLLKDSGPINDDYQVRHVVRISQALEILDKTDEIDIILSDISLPDSYGEYTFNVLLNKAEHLPILFMAGSDDETAAQAALSKGAQDYLIKGQTQGPELDRAIRHAIERKKSQKEMKRVLADSRQKVQETQLLKAQRKQLIELNRAKDEFISMASHQLRTPATAVKQYLGMMLEGYLGDIPENYNQFLQIAYDSNERQLTIINDLLRTAQIDAKNFTLRKQRTDLRAAVDEIVKNFEAVFGYKRQTVEVLSTNEMFAVVDADEMRLVLTNLIENASKYTAPGKNIYIRLEKHNQEAIIEIQDEGVGITENNIGRIFDKFTRIDNELSDTVAGSGLGLYWVNRIIKLHKGTITVDSEIGKGTTFSIKVPA